MNAETSHQLSTYDPELFEMLIKGRAEHISNNRKLEIIFWRYLEDLNNMGKLPWNEEQMRWDWSEACALVTLQILEGDKTLLFLHYCVPKSLIRCELKLPFELTSLQRCFLKNENLIWG